MKTKRRRGWECTEDVNRRGSERQRAGLEVKAELSQASTIHLCCQLIRMTLCNRFQHIICHQKNQLLHFRLEPTLNQMNLVLNFSGQRNFFIKES